MNKAVYKMIEKHLAWIEIEIKLLNTVDNSSLRAVSFIAGKVYAYKKERHFLYNILKLLDDDNSVTS